jgi:hypothetical protein
MGIPDLMLRRSTSQGRIIRYEIWFQHNKNIGNADVLRSSWSSPLQCWHYPPSGLTAARGSLLPLYGHSPRLSLAKWRALQPNLWGPCQNLRLALNAFSFSRCPFIRFQQREVCGNHRQATMGMSTMAGNRRQSQRHVATPVIRGNEALTKQGLNVFKLTNTPIIGRKAY